MGRLLNSYATLTAAQLEAQRDRLTRCSKDLHHALGCGSQLVIIPASKEALPS
nr:MAG TPA: hypothetical protein [Caudoviricetes sp.]